MRAVITVRDARRGTQAHVVVDAEPETPMNEIVDSIRSSLGSQPGWEQPGQETVAAASGSSDSFARSGLVDGAVLTIGEAAPGATLNQLEKAPARMVGGCPEGLVEVLFVSGGESGRVGRLKVGETLLGLDEVDGTVRFGSSVESESAVASVLVDIDGTVSVRSRDESTRVELETEEVTAESSYWLPGMQLHVGGSILTVRVALVSAAELIPSPDGGWLDYNRPPRLLPRVPVHTFRLPTPPPPPTRNNMPWITAMIPAVLGVTMAIAMKQPFYLLFAVMSPMMMIGNSMSTRKNGKQSHKHLLAEHKKTRLTIMDAVDAAVAEEQSGRRVAVPDAAELLLAARGPTRRLWERRSTDPDHLVIRVGIADQPSGVQLEDMAQLEFRRKSTGMTRAVPATLSISESGVIGVAGPGDWPRQLGRWILGQLAVLQSPRDLQVYVLSSHESAADWDWAHWLPHLRPAVGQEAFSLTGSDAETLGRRVAELSQLVADRLKEASAIGSRTSTFSPDVLVVLDGARRLRAMPGIVALLRDGPCVGVYILCLDAEERQLPEECTAVIIPRAAGELMIKKHHADDIDGVLADVISGRWFEEVARSLSPMRDASPSDADGLLPKAAQLLDVLGLEDPTAESIMSMWSGSGGRSTEAVIGISLDGPFSIDLVRDGPHGLVAGTTGSGKSEFLQTLVAALAAANRPDSMTFVLIDYKGGAAFSGCMDLPHTVGMVTDLDSHLVERALDSLRAELVRREYLLGLAGAKDIEDYYAHQGRGGHGIDLPRLVIVIDEFAAMAKELPDFVAGLIGIAQRGRSLGIHLVMATQRPSGVISPEIRANTNLRIALRMTDAGESSDVIDIPDAARISQSIPGRAYARLGHASIIPFQTARIGGARTVAASAATGADDASSAQTVPRRAPFVARLTTKQFAMPMPQPPRRAQAVTAQTDLSVLVTAIRDASSKLEIAVQHSPWLQPLAESISLEHLLELSPAGAGQSPGIAWAREDLPSSQEQQNAVLDLTRFGHLYIVGAPGSGRSQALRTIAVSAATNESPADVHIYGIDCGNGALASLASLPHCGAVTQRNQAERATRLIERLQSEMLRRHELLGAGNFANVTEQRRDGCEAGLPHLLVFIDRWENFLSTLGEIDGGRLADTLQDVLRDGASAGVHLIISGDRSLLGSRMGVLTEDKVVLRMTDRLDYSLANLNHKTIPAEIPPGRGYRAGSRIELQIALLGDDPSGQAQTAAVHKLGRDLAAAAAQVPAAQRPFRVDDLPKALDIDQALGFTGGVENGPMWALIGVGGDQLFAHGMDFENDAPTFVVAGPARSGRSTLLGVMACSLLRSGTELVLVCPRSSPLRELVDMRGVRALVTNADLAETDLAPHLDPDGTSTPVVLIVDDGELVVDSPARTWLRNYVRTAGDNRRGLILGGNAAEIGAGFSGWQVDARKNRRGALLSPQSTVDGDLVGVRVTRSMVSSKITPGRALVHLGTGDFLTLQIPSIVATARQSASV